MTLDEGRAYAVTVEFQSPTRGAMSGVFAGCAEPGTGVFMGNGGTSDAARAAIGIVGPFAHISVGRAPRPPKAVASYEPAPEPAPPVRAT